MSDDARMKLEALVARGLLIKCFARSEDPTSRGVSKLACACGATITWSGLTAVPGPDLDTWLQAHVAHAECSQ